jgi:hypothetical protein
LIAHFERNPPPKYNVNLSVLPVNSGVVTGGGSYDSGTVVNVSAIANNNYTFKS